MKLATLTILGLLAVYAQGQQMGGDRDILPQSQTTTSSEAGQAHCPL